MKKAIVIHPFFFAIYAVIGLYSQRPGESPIEWTFRSQAVALILVMLAYRIARKWTGNSHRAGLIATLFLAWLLVGHIRNIVLILFHFTPSLLQDILIMVAWSLIIAFLGSNWLWERIKIPEMITNFLNITSWVVIILPVYFAISISIQTMKQIATLESLSPESITTDRSINHPDIYVIYLDAYGSNDLLQEVFDYDNHQFTDYLVKKGFYIAEHSRPNYPQTQISVASLLNMNYLDEYVQGLENSNLRTPLNALIQKNAVQKTLKELGYTLVTVSNSTTITAMEDSDIVLEASTLELNHFEGTLLSTTVADMFMRIGALDLPIPSYDRHRQVITFQLETLKHVADIPGPKFVFVHILSPHPPFVFDKDGNPVQPNVPFTLADGENFPGTVEEYEQGYTAQLTYINAQIEEVLNAILDPSRPRPIIILQGDHGPGSRFSMLGLDKEACLWERYSILNAYYFPDQHYDSLYSSITPVNSFRVIFNAYFGADLPILEDQNFYATYAYPYKYYKIDNISTECASE